jgi:hypothetical protein
MLVARISLVTSVNPTAARNGKCQNALGVSDRSKQQLSRISIDCGSDLGADSDW